MSDILLVTWYIYWCHHLYLPGITLSFIYHFTWCHVMFHSERSHSNFDADRDVDFQCVLGNKDKTEWINVVCLGVTLILPLDVCGASVGQDWIFCNQSKVVFEISWLLNETHTHTHTHTCQWTTLCLKTARPHSVYYYICNSQRTTVCATVNILLLV